MLRELCPLTPGLRVVERGQTAAVCGQVEIVADPIVDLLCQESNRTKDGTDPTTKQVSDLGADLRRTTGTDSRTRVDLSLDPRV